MIQNEFINEKGIGFFEAVFLSIFNSIDQEELCKVIEQKLSVYPKSKQRKISISLISNKSKLPSVVKEDLKNYLLLSKTKQIPELINENTQLLQ